MLLVVALIFGVLGMHTFVVVSAAPAAAALMPSPVAMAPAVGLVGSAYDSADQHEAATAPATVVQPVGDRVVRHGAGHDSMPLSMHQVLHLCVAILVALLVLGMAALALWPTLRPDRSEAPIGALLRSARRRRAPPTSVRLAQLCVLRN